MHSVCKYRMDSTGTTQPEQKGLSHLTPALSSHVHRSRPSRCGSAAPLSTVVQLPLVVVAVDETWSSPLVTSRTHQKSWVWSSVLLTWLRLHHMDSDSVVDAPKLSLVVTPLPLNSTVNNSIIHVVVEALYCILSHWHIIRLTLIHSVDCAKCHVTRVVKLD